MNIYKTDDLGNCPHCGEDAIRTKKKTILYVVRTSDNTRNTRLLQLYWCGECKRKFVGEKNG